jgi:hypothetical protein
LRRQREPVPRPRGSTPRARRPSRRDRILAGVGLIASEKISPPLRRRFRFLEEHLGRVTGNPPSVAPA